MNKKIWILVAIAIASAIAGLSYLFYQRSTFSNNKALIAIDGEPVLTIGEFEEYAAIVKKEHLQSIYFNLWQNAAIKAWNKKNKIDQLPEYQKHFKEMEEWHKAHPEDNPKDRTEALKNTIQCMFLIECWFRNIDNSYFVHHFPLFQSALKESGGSMNFDKFGQMHSKMVSELNKEVTTIENTKYLKQNNLKDINSVINDSTNPQCRRDAQAVSNLLSDHSLEIALYSKDKTLLGNFTVPAAITTKSVGSTSTQPSYKELEVTYKDKDQQKLGVHQINIKALDKNGKTAKEKTITLEENRRDFCINALVDPDTGEIEFFV